MATASDLVMMDPDELEIRLEESRKELFNLRFQLATGQLDNSARMGQVRRDVARILTVLRDREIQEAEGIYEPPVSTRRAARVAAARAEEAELEEAELTDAEDDELEDAEDDTAGVGQGPHASEELAIDGEHGGAPGGLDNDEEA